MSFSNKLVLKDWILENSRYGYVESRREQGGLREEFVMKEKVLRGALIRSMREMEEMKRAQELLVDEFSLQKLRESHETTQRLTSQVQELQERMNYLSLWRISLHVVEKSHVSSQPTRIPSPRSLLSSDERLQPDTWNRSGSQETFLQLHVRRSSHYKYLIKGLIHLRLQMPQVRLPPS